MEYAQLGRSGLSISRVAMGCMSLPLDEAANSIIHHALSLGINYFDTADIYNDGINEEIVGKALRGRRHEAIIASKVGNVRKKDGGLDWNPSRQHILRSIDESLRRLSTEYIDVYQLHGGTINDNIDEVIETFELLIQQGKIRHYGISSIRPNVVREYVSKSQIVSVMMQYSLLDRRPEEECLDLLQTNNIGILARGSVAQGLLVGKPSRPYLDLSAEEVRHAAEAVELLTNPSRTNTAIALGYVLQKEGITSAVVGMRTTEHVDEAVVAAVSAPNLSAGELESLAGAVRALRYKEHR